MDASMVMLVISHIEIAFDNGIVLSTLTFISTDGLRA